LYKRNTTVVLKTTKYDEEEEKRMRDEYLNHSSLEATPELAAMTIDELLKEEWAQIDIRYKKAVALAPKDREDCKAWVARNTEKP